MADDLTKRGSRDARERFALFSVAAWASNSHAAGFS